MILRVAATAMSCHVCIAYQMEDMMKNSSTKQPPKGSTPPSRMVITGFKYLEEGVSSGSGSGSSIPKIVRLSYHGWGGICLGMLEVTTGNSMASFLYPKYAPKNVRGTEIQNHRVSTANMLKKGTAPTHSRDTLWSL